MSDEASRNPPLARNDWAYFLDFDGTLLELAETPDAIVVDPALPALLAALQHSCAGAVALVSGRALADLDSRLALPRLAKAGQHGMERRDAAGRVTRHSIAPQARQAIRTALAPLLQAHPGLLIEDKGLSLAVHYRRAPELASWVQQRVYQLVAGIGQGLIAQTGKYVVEIRPGGVDKGTAVAEYLAEPPFLGRRPVFVGDDRSDEQGFAVVNACGGISIGVGAGSADARYLLPGVSAVRAWLTRALDQPPR